MINVSEIVFGEKGNDGFIPTRINGNIVSFQIGSVDAPLRAPFGVSEPIGGSTNVDRRTLDLEVEGELAGTMKAIDAAVVAEAIKRPMAFFGRQLDEATVRAMHQPLVTAKEEHTPTVRTKVKVGAKAPTTVRIVTGENKFRRGTADEVAKGSKVMAIVNLNSVWFASKMFGVSLSVDHLVVWPPKPSGLAAFTGLEGFVEE